MDPEDISAWMGRPPASVSRMLQIEQEHGRDIAADDASASSMSMDNEIAVINVDDTPTSPALAGRVSYNRTLSEPDLVSVATVESNEVRVVIPRLSKEEQALYGFLPGHFSAKRVLSEVGRRTFLVELESGEIEKVSHERLKDLDYGPNVLLDFRALRTHHQRAPSRPSALEQSQTTSSEADGDTDSSHATGHRSKRRKVEVNFLDESSQSEDDVASSRSRSVGRRSSRLARTKSVKNYAADVVFLDDSDNAVSARSRRSARRKDHKPETPTDSWHATRRSERVSVRKSMREKQENDISSASEKEIGPKIVGTKEHFVPLAEHDPFRKWHRQDCDTCYFSGDNAQKGPLVFCQGCTNAYHKVCLGPRGSREHLVTKADDNLFVLQCRRCIGVPQEKDPLAPHHGTCSSESCSQLGPASVPFRKRLTTKQEQLQREENGGMDPITVIAPNLINNTQNILFRCATCQRAWHMYHLPDRKIDGEEDDQFLTQEQLAQSRFDLYHRSWTCKECIEHQQVIDVLVAWRPAHLPSYIPGTPGEAMAESQKEYLIKWKGQSYLRVTWMPGSWVWGIAAAPMRASFMRKPENALPKMTTKDAVPEEFLRIDIVFEVRYTSVVRNSSKEIDLVRAKEVDSAFVKYKGLGYEDAIWEKPPTYTETERWDDFKVAYEDYVKKVYISIPSQSTLRRHLQAIRSRDFTSIVRQTQPDVMTGGQLMQYQLEGLNWLYCQWFISHGAILADEMGLGKTIQIIAFLTTLVHEHKCWPFLVVVPNSTCPNWKREIRKWVPSLRVVTYYGSERARKLTHDFELFPKDADQDKEDFQKTGRKRSEAKDIKAHIVIASYESIVEEKTRKSLLRVPWQGLIVDEGQRLKNDKGLIYESLSRFNFPFKALLTGTPLQNNARELFNLLQFLDKSIKASDLEAQYAKLTEENVPELREKLRPFFLRRTKVQVLTFLPPVAQIIVPVTMSSVQKRVYKSILSQNPHLMKAIFSRDSSLSQKERFNLNNILMQLRKTLCHPFVYSREIEERTSDQEAAHQGLVNASAKLQLLQIMLPKLQERGHRVLIFSQFLDNLDVMEDFLDGLGMLHRRLDGSINALEKQKRIDEYNAPNSPYFAFLLSTRAGGVGINLATADTVIIMDPDFNPHQDIQALSRAHRIGQQNKVLVFQLMTKSSAEEKVMAIGKKKMALDHVLIERMDQADDAGENLESILRFGAEALFEDQENDDDRIVYDSASVDKLLDRSQIESTKTSDDQSAESQFSFARIWMNKESSLQEGLQDADGIEPVNTDIWDKILQERERAYQEELARKEETFGRGKRKRGQVHYSMKQPDGGDASPRAQDSDYTSQDGGDFQDAPSSSEGEPEDEPVPIRTVRTRPYVRVKVPAGVAPHFNGEIPMNYIPMGGMPPHHRCTGCNEEHPMGWCRLKIAGVEHCGLCGQAHIGHGRTCPHLNDERQVNILLATLKESTEPREIIEEAQKYLKLIRSHLVSQRRAQEKAAAEAQSGMTNTNAHLRHALGGPLSSTSRVYNPVYLPTNDGRNQGQFVHYDDANHQGQRNGNDSANYDSMLRNSMANLTHHINSAVSNMHRG